MYFLKRTCDFKSICTIVRLSRYFYSSQIRKSHYDILNLRKNCSDKEIKNAFIQMSKEYHPDKNKDAKAQEKFVKIVEAYNILSKPSSRAQYDNIMDSQVKTHSYVYRTHTPYNFRNNTAYNYYEQPNSKANDKKTGYYGVKGLKKLSNLAITVLCFTVALVGTIIQLVVIRQSYLVHRKRTQEKSKILAEELEKVRENAKGKTNSMQTQALLDKIVSSSNSTVATASLGQALANEKSKS
ncbi:dnaJ-like protein 60 isoform X1 [Pieris napi]|uniref:dnaJ-like protein 60 isoform X1 n=1 Tax=Pieris napi TaxID=78633 RepID=UPI001FBB53E3|nr:dnaJ-like protein 60 isoform X1 [Pieris napi]